MQTVCWKCFRAPAILNHCQKLLGRVALVGSGLQCLGRFTNVAYDFMAISGNYFVKD